MKLSSVLKAVGFLTWVLAIIAGFFTASQLMPVDGGFNFLALLVICIPGFISGLIFFALGEILDRQEDLKETQDRLIAMIENKETK